MSYYIKINKKEGLYVQKPSICPHCQKGIDAIALKPFAEDYYNQTYLYVPMKCPICQNIFISKYTYNLTSQAFNVLYRGSEPVEIIGGNKVKKEFNEEIINISPMFVKMYNEAFIAEQSGCEEIIGAAYRTAFEFLIKDFAINCFEDEKEKIARMPLIQVVENYSPDEDTKGILSRATWLGNDFAHYENKHEDFSVSDLKNLIELSCSAISSCIKKKKYINQIKKV